MTSSKVVIGFDLYGTLLSTDSIAREIAKQFNDDIDIAKSVASLWRRYQLEYTWRINSMGEYKTFDEITRSALGHALAEHRLGMSTNQANLLMRAYDALNVFPEVPTALKLLEEKSRSVEAHIFSNGTLKMATTSVKKSPDLGPHADIFKSLITVDDLRVFKPDPRVYRHLVHQVNKIGQESDVWLVSANPFDVVGAKASGLKTAWIDRAGKGWLDRLDEMRVPSIIATGVDEAVKGIVTWEADIRERKNSKKHSSFG